MIDEKGVDLNLLKVFQALASELNATRAAVRLGVSQAAVSASLKRLRLLYGDPLFRRTQRGLQATPRAILLQPAISEALRIVGETLEPAQNARSQPTHLFRIGLSDDFEMAFGAEILRLVREQLPRTRLVFRQTNAAMAAAALHDREFDLALVSGSLGDARIRHQSLGSSDYRIVFDPATRAGQGAFTLQEFLDCDHLLVSFSGITGITDDVLAEHGLKRTVGAATTHFAGLPFLLRGSPHLATIPSHAADALCRLGIFESSPCPVAFPRYAFGLNWHFEGSRRADLLAMRDLISTMFKRLQVGTLSL